jgi:hypothetical protein
MTEKEQIKFYKKLTKQMVKEALNEVVDKKSLQARYLKRQHFKQHHLG